VILTADGRPLESTHGAGSILKFHNAFEEKSGMPKTNQPRWFSYRTSMCASAVCGGGEGSGRLSGVLSPLVWSTRLICWSAILQVVLTWSVKAEGGSGARRCYRGCMESMCLAGKSCASSVTKGLHAKTATPAIAKSVCNHNVIELEN
jgi:hypothetical protein